MIDIDSVIATEDGTRFDRVAAAVIGAIAILAALLGILQMDLSQRAASAGVLGARLSIQTFEGIAGGSMRTSFEINASQDAITISLDALSRAIVALSHGQDADVETARTGAAEAASERLIAIAAQMGALPGPDSALDSRARRAVSDDVDALEHAVTEQNHQVDLSSDYGARGGRAVLGLSLLALAGVLIGLAEVLGEGQAGRFALAAATVATVLAAIAGASGLI